MATDVTVPITVTPDAAARIAALEIQPAVECMLEYARRHLPAPDRIEITLYDRYELGDEPGLAIDVYSRRPFDPTDGTDRVLDRWMATEFPPEVLEHIVVSYRPGTCHAG